MGGLQNMNRKMGIDYGSVRIGIAISDPLGITARGIETINWNGEDMDWAISRIVELCKNHSVDTVVIGLPRRTDGKESISEQKAKILSERVNDEAAKASISLKIILRDERYTTVLAHRIMRETGMKQAKKRSVVDQIAAEIILQDFLDHSSSLNRI